MDRDHASRADGGAAWTPARMAARIVRHGDLVPCTAAFIDARTPGSHLKENFTIIGPGVAESPRQHVHVRVPHGFNIGAARQPPGIVNSQHSHETAEVFMVQRGTWKFVLGPQKQDGAVVLQPGDTISIPVQVFRGFENVGSDAGFMFAILGGDDPGRVTWSPDVLEAAHGHGLVLLEDGRLVDTLQGETVPPGARTARPLDAAAMRRFRRAGPAELGLARRADAAPAREFALPGAAARTGLVIAGEGRVPIAWPHGFCLRTLELPGGGRTDPHRLDCDCVVLVHQGAWRLHWDDRAGGSGSAALGPGDTATIPPGIERVLEQISADGFAWIVTRGDVPARAEPARAAAA